MYMYVCTTTVPREKSEYFLCDGAAVRPAGAGTVLGKFWHDRLTRLGRTIDWLAAFALGFPPPLFCLVGFVMWAVV